MHYRYYVLFVAFMLLLSPAIAQSVKDSTLKAEGQNFYDMTLEQLMSLEVTVASKQSLTTRESPGVVSLVTEEEITASGARDLVDILRLVPGFDFCVDVEGVVGISMRGNWAHEGKVLLLIDGLEMNENLYSTLQFGSHYPVNNIKRIEIIRGPGSAMYGGNAEYAVINIITKSALDLKGGEANINYGHMNNGPGQYDASISLGDQVRDFSYSVNVTSGSSIRSDRTYHDFWGGSYNMAANSEINSNHLNVGLQFRKMKFRGIIDKYSIDTRDNYDKVLENTYRVRFDTYIGDLRQEISLTPKLELIPFVNIKTQLPWNYSGTVWNNEFTPFSIQSSRYTGGFSGTWKPVDNFNVIGGTEYFYDKAVQQADKLFVSTGTKHFYYNNTSVYTQASLQTKIVDITAGARYNYNDRYDDSFVPRVSVTRVFERMHFKLLYSEAYRTPNTENIDLNTAISPEHTTVIEFEAGTKLFPTVYLTGNFYDITTHQDGYRNASRTGTKGIELDVQWKFRNGYLDCSYELYSAAGKNKLEENSVPGKKESLLGISNQQFTMSANYRLKQRFSVNPSLCLLGKRYGMIAMNAIDEPLIGSFDPVYLVNLTFRADDVFIKGLNTGLSFYNILDHEEIYLQPYKGGHAGLPGRSREFILHVSYHFKKK